VAPREFGHHRPELLGERVVEVHARDGLHHAAVAQAQTVPVNGLHAPDVGGAVLCDRDTGITVDGAGHAGGPEQFLTDVAIDELVQVAEKLGEFPGLGERRRDEFDQRLGIVRRQMLVRQGRSETGRMRRLRDASAWRDAQ
jgi:hypothetical protein